jgi:hypothetical protein
MKSQQGWTTTPKPDYTRVCRLAVRAQTDARVAQLVEHAIENRSVGGSTPSPGTTVTSVLNIGLRACPVRAIVVKPWPKRWGVATSA